MKTVEPKVELIAHTTLVNNGRSPVIENYMNLDREGSDPQQLIEFAGRACYQSFHKPNKATARNKDYLERTLHNQAHWSIAEHATATFYITGVSRALTHELIRHRNLSYSQLSQRFVNESEANIVIPPAIRDAKTINEIRSIDGFDGEVMGATEDLQFMGSFAAGTYESLVEDLQEVEGLTRKQAREAARAVLPNMVETRIVVTGNMRAWHEVITRRTAPDADAEMREVMGLVRKQLEKVSPVIFGGDSDDAQQVSCENM